MGLLQFLHLPFWSNQLIKGIFSLQVNLFLHFGQKLLGFIIDKLLGKRKTITFKKLPIQAPIIKV